jgi:hypothetical protein
MCRETESVLLVASSVGGSWEVGSFAAGSCVVGSCAPGSCAGCGGFAACSPAGVRSVLSTTHYNVVSLLTMFDTLGLVRFYLSLIRSV